jgi:hypothetical protein
MIDAERLGILGLWIGTGKGAVLDKRVLILPDLGLTVTPSGYGKMTSDGSTVGHNGCQ